MKTLFILIPLSFITCFSFGQKAENEIEKSYKRISITNVIIRPTFKYYRKEHGKKTVIQAKSVTPSELDLSVINGLAKMKMHNKFNDDRIDHPILPLSAKIKGSASWHCEECIFSPVVDYLKGKESNSQVVMDIKAVLEKMVSREIIAKWFNQDNDGNFNTNFLEERAKYSALNRDFKQSGNMAVNRIEMIGPKLINNAHIIVYNIVDVKSMEEIYEEHEKKTSSSQQWEGYKTVVDAFLFKIDFNDSIASYFYKKCWSDTNNVNYDNLDNFDRTRFTVEFVKGGRFTANRSQPIGLSPYYLTHKRKSKSELLYELPEYMQYVVLKKYFGEEVKVKVTLEKVTAIESAESTKSDELEYGVNLGIKEGLRVDQKFIAYEVSLDPITGKQFKTKIGAIRITHVADNTVENGKGELSKFRQTWGKPLYPGVLIIEKF